MDQFPDSDGTVRPQRLLVSLEAKLFPALAGVAIGGMLAAWGGGRLLSPQPVGDGLILVVVGAAIVLVSVCLALCRTP